MSLVMVDLSGPDELRAFAQALQAQDAAAELASTAAELMLRDAHLVRGLK